MKTLTSIAEIKAALVRTSSELIEANGQAFYKFQEGKLGNDLFINDPERADRIYNAAEYGADGSTHAEHIEDFRDYAEFYYRKIRDAAFRLEITDDESMALDAEIDDAEEKLTESLDALETWHEKNGSLHQQVG